MPDGAAYEDTREHPNASEGGQAAPGTPRWVKVSAIVAVVLVVVLIVMMVAGGEHGPGRHLGGGDPPAAGQDEGGRQTPPSDTPEGHEPPAWVPEH